MISVASTVFPAAPIQGLYIQSELPGLNLCTCLTLFGHVVTLDVTSPVLFCFIFCGYSLGLIYEPQSLKELLSLKEFLKSGF